MEIRRDENIVASSTWIEIDWQETSKSVIATIMKTKYVIMLLILCLLIVITVIGRLGKAPQEDASAEIETPRSVRPHNDLRHASRRERSQRRALSELSGKLQRIKDLEVLKKQWVALGPARLGPASEDEFFEERNELARKSNDLLLCSEEMIELLEFLERNNISTGGVAMPDMQLFSSEHAQEARSLLLDLSGKRDPHGREYREIWSYYAGRKCTEEEFLDFYTRMRSISPNAAQEALFARNEVLVEKQPEEAVSSTLSALEKNITSPHMGTILGGLLRNLPRSADFAKIERMLSDVDFDPSPWGVTDPRSELFETWGLADFPAAADFALSNIGELPPRVIRKLGSAAVEELGADGAMDWIRTIPEGAHRDAVAANATIGLQFSDPERARQIASFITDSAKRKRVLAMIDDHSESGLQGEENH